MLKNTQPGDPSNIGGLVANIRVLNEFLEEYMPAFSGPVAPGEFYHLNTHRKRSFTRNQSQIQMSLISGRPVNSLDTRIELETHDNSTYYVMSLEDALDLHICMSFDPLNHLRRDRFNPFKIHFEQKQMTGQLGVYI